MKRTGLVVFLLFPMSILYSQIIVDAGSNDTICVPGQPVQLLGTKDDSSECFYSHWFPSNTLSNDTVLNPIAMPLTTTTYYLSCFYESQNNLVVNGDFQGGNQNFFSQYEYKAIYFDALWNAATYSVVMEADQVHPHFPGGYDHTYGNPSGRFMVVNGAGTPNTIVWEQQIDNIVPHTDYVFYAWVRTLVATSPAGLAKLQFSINGELVGDVFTSPYPASLGWTQFYTIWNSRDVNTSVVIRIINQNVNENENDFGLDDIYFAPILPITDSVTIFVGQHIQLDTFATLCYGDEYEFAGNILTQAGDYHDTLRSVLGCDSIVTLHLSFRDELTVNLGDDIEVCVESNAKVKLTPKITSYASYVWSDGSSERYLEVFETGTYHVTVTDEYGCEATDSVSVHFIEMPEVEIINNTENFCDVYLAELVAVSANAASYEWNTYETTSAIIAEKSGTYWVIARNQNCKTQAFYTIEPCDFFQYFPNAFTPSGADGVNDYFGLSDPDAVQTLQVAIYNRFGQAVYTSNNPHFQWDGKFGGKYVSPGLYNYVISLTSHTGKRYVYKGVVTVL